MSVLLKTKTLLHLATWKRPYYLGVVYDGYASSVVNLELSEEAWLDMECPSTLTVTVEIGDTLNEDDDQ